ncbi:MAG: ATP-binding cassette domain-containing protein [Clostridiales Family XIII bacterium]|jgi:peptide/nickel transport system ATP-binding protein|nr:ATP-binding cassette domain-containing protein [Clostridiales Family XIII bacterium]
MRLEARQVSFRYAKGDRRILTHVDLCVEAGERVALVGPSGCGKSTLARILAGYLAPSEGTVLWNGKPLPAKGFCPVQLICQHPELSVNPRHRMSKILCEAWTPDADIAEAMGIEAEWLSRRPNELSGGELQRFCIVRALAPQTKFLVCDEISTMLDVITQAQIWELLLRVAKKNGLGMIVITHNGALANRVCDRIISLPEINGDASIHPH